MSQPVGREQAVAKLKQQAHVFAEKVLPLYRLLDWRWHDESAPPTAPAIEKCILELIKSIEGRDGSCRSGGLSVWCEPDGWDWNAGMDFTLAEDTWTDMTPDEISAQPVVEDAR